jgi:hypothetical protein
MKIKYIFLILIITFCSNLYAQTAERDEDRFFYGAGTDKDLKVILPDNTFSQKGIQYGAILSPVYLFEDNDGGQLGSYVLNAKIWAKTYLWENAFFYIRGKNSYLGIQINDGSYSSVESDNVLDLDLAYLSASSGTGSLNLSLGRKFYTIGSGLVLNGRGDGGEASWYGANFNINLMGLYTGLLLKDNNPYGLSDKDITDGAERAFGGGTIGAAFLNQKLYLFGLAQIDMSTQEDGVETKYDSQYYGGGLEGVLFQDISYFAEFVYETGTSYISKGAVVNEESTIAAYAVNSGINYYIPVPLSPVLLLQYAYGSGDKYRTSYTTSNRPSGAEGDDTGFIAFGTFSGGYALKANLGNIHIFKGGFSFSPVSKMSLGVKYLYYMKDKKEMPISSGDAALPEAFVGQGVDVSLRWQMFYDLSMYVNYGLFLPGDAYDPSMGEKSFAMAGINLSI